MQRGLRCNRFSWITETDHNQVSLSRQNKSLLLFLLLVIFSGPGCLVEKSRIMRFPRKEHTVVLAKLKENGHEVPYQGVFSAISKKYGPASGKTAVIGLYNRRVLAGIADRGLSDPTLAGLIQLVFRGEKKWGGIIGVFDGDHRPLLWHEEPPQTDQPLEKNSPLVKVRAWWIPRVNQYAVFCYRPNRGPDIEEIKQEAETYARCLGRAFTDIVVYVFYDRLECRQFASEKNREFLLSMTAISPGNDGEFFQPRHTGKGIWCYRLKQGRGPRAGHWWRIKPVKKHPGDEEKDTAGIGDPNSG